MQINFNADAITDLRLKNLNSTLRVSKSELIRAAVHVLEGMDTLDILEACRMQGMASAEFDERQMLRDAHTNYAEGVRQRCCRLSAAWAAIENHPDCPVDVMEAIEQSAEDEYILTQMDLGNIPQDLIDEVEAAGAAVENNGGSDEPI